MTDNYRIQLGARIREVRRAAGYNQGGDFARALGLDPSQLSRIERGLRRIDSMLLRRIATVLDVPLDSLFPDSRTGVALARQGDGADAKLKRMIDWALELRTDLDIVEDHVAGRVR